MPETFIKPIEINGKTHERILIKTRLISSSDNIVEVAKTYTNLLLKPGDTLVVSERIVAITQGRSFLISEIKPSFWARTLWPFVTKNPGGIGLRSPHTMELALREAGVARVVFAAIASLITKPLGMKGVFYRVAGHGLNAIDGPCDYTLPPGNMSAKLGPKDAGDVARRISEAVGVPVAIIDANDLGQRIEGVSEGVDERLVLRAFSDNPFGQRDEQTPIAVLRCTNEG